jgi:hypothetical protein
LQSTTATTAIPEDAFSVATIKVEIERCLGAMEKEKKASNVRKPYCKANDEKDQTRSYSAPTQVVAFSRYLLSLVVPSKTEAPEWATSTNEKLTFYKRLFPPGTTSFAIPKSDRTRPSDPDYAIIGGVRVHLI